MPKKNPEFDPAPDKAKVRIFFAEVEGSNESVKEAVRAMVHAMNRPAPTALRVAANGSASALPIPAADASPAAEEPEFIEEVDEGEEAEASAAPARKARGTGPKKNHNAGIELVPNMDFRPDDEKPLKDFFAEKAPKTDGDQTIVVMYYMQHMMGLTGMGYGHIRTAFRDVNKPVPADLRSTVRHLKRQKAYVMGEPDSFQVTTQGENYVEHEMKGQGDAE